MYMHEAEVGHFVFPVELSAIITESAKDCHLQLNRFVFLEVDEQDDVIIYHYLSESSKDTVSVYCYPNMEQIRIVFNPDTENEKQAFKSLCQFVTCN